MTAPHILYAMAPSALARRGVDSGAPPASGARRGMAYLVDLVVWLVVVVGIDVVSHSWVMALIVGVEVLILFVFLQAGTGAAVGGRLLRVRTVKEGTDHAPGLALQTGRSLIMVGLHLTVLGPLITCLTTKDGQDWIDRLVGTACTQLVKESSPARRGADHEPPSYTPPTYTPPSYVPPSYTPPTEYTVPSRTIWAPPPQP